MPTEKPRFTVTVSDDMKRRIEDYQFSNRMRNQNQAVSHLIERGLNAIDEIVEENEPSLPMHPDILPVTRQRIPLIGSIACGEPIFADEDMSASIAVDHPVDCDFALRCRGDSMIGARILDGDVVFIRKQDVVDDGSIAAVLIDDDATLKRVYHLADGRVELRAENPKYAPIVIGGENETRMCRILGKAVAFQSALI